MTDAVQSTDFARRWHGDRPTTYDGGYLHVLTHPGGPCWDRCPHPDHNQGDGRG